MSEELQSVFNIEHIFRLCSEKYILSFNNLFLFLLTNIFNRNLPGDSNIGVLISQNTYSESWTAFNKLLSLTQIQLIVIS